MKHGNLFQNTYLLIKIKKLYYKLPGMSNYKKTHHPFSFIPLIVCHAVHM